MRARRYHPPPRATSRSRRPKRGPAPGARPAPRQGRLVHERPAQLRRIGEQAGDELVFLVDVAVQQLGQRVLVEVGPHAHHGEFEEAGHGRREDVEAPPLMHPIEEKRAFGEAVEQALGGALRQLPRARGPAHREGAQGQLRQQLRVSLVEEEREDALQKARRHHTRRKAVHPVNEAAIAGWSEMVGHRVFGRRLVEINCGRVPRWRTLLLSRARAA